MAISTPTEVTEQASGGGASMSDYEFAERIIRRLKPRNLQEVFDKAASTSRLGGMLITLMVAVWWLGIYSQDDLSLIHI